MKMNLTFYIILFTLLAVQSNKGDKLAT